MPSVVLPFMSNINSQPRKISEMIARGTKVKRDIVSLLAFFCTCGKYGGSFCENQINSGIDNEVGLIWEAGVGLAKPMVVHQAEESIRRGPIPRKIALPISPPLQVAVEREAGHENKWHSWLILLLIYER